MVFSDISSRTFPVLKKNLTRHRITGALILRSDILSAFGKEVFDLIVANPPYVEDYFLKNNSALTYEPRAALAGGPDGLDICRKILGSARQCLKPGGRLLMEIGSGSTVKLEEYAIKYWDYAEYTIMKDYAGHPRIISLKKEHG
jgi:HemK-like putative methylase